MYTPVSPLERERRVAGSPEGQKEYWSARKAAGRRRVGSSAWQGAKKGFALGAGTSMAASGAMLSAGMFGDSPKSWAIRQGQQALGGYINQGMRKLPKGTKPWHVLAAPVVGGSVGGALIGAYSGYRKGKNPWHRSREHTDALRQAHNKLSSQEYLNRMAAKDYDSIIPRPVKENILEGKKINKWLLKGRKTSEQIIGILDKKKKKAKKNVHEEIIAGLIEAEISRREGERPKKPFDWRKAGEMLGGALVGAAYGGAAGYIPAQGVGKTVRLARGVENALVNDELSKRENGWGQAALVRRDPQRNKRVNLLDPKAIITGKNLKRSSLPKGVTWAQSPSTIQKWGRQAGATSGQSSALARMAGDPGAAFARAPNVAGKRPLVVAGKHLTRETIQHEFGHAQLMNQERRTVVDTTSRNAAPVSLVGDVKKHPTYREEKQAWDISGVPQGHIQPRLALKTYETSLKARKAARQTSVGMQAGGVATGAVIGAKIAGDRVDQRREQNLKAARGRINLVHPKSQIVREELIASILEAKKNQTEFSMSQDRWGRPNFREKDLGRPGDYPHWNIYKADKDPVLRPKDPPPHFSLPRARMEVTKPKTARERALDYSRRQTQEGYTTREGLIEAILQKIL